jgi:ankyrin repeat protein
VAIVDEEREPITRNTALHWAIKENRTEIFNKLLEASDVNTINSVNKYGRSALHFAVIFKRKQAIKRLIEKGADIDMKDQWGCTPLMLAQGNWRYELCVLLCAAGADLSIKGLNLNAMLFSAVESNNADAVRKLADAGVDVLRRNATGQTALDIALEKGEEADEVSQILSKRTFYIKEETEKVATETSLASSKRKTPLRMPTDAEEESMLLERVSKTNESSYHSEASLRVLSWPKIPLTPPLTPPQPQHSTHFVDSPTETESAVRVGEEIASIEVEIA